MADKLLLEDGVSFLLLEDGVSRLLLESAGSVPVGQSSQPDYLFRRPSTVFGLFVTQTLLLSTLTPSTPAEPRAPTYVARATRPAPQQFQVPNLLTTTLAPIVAGDPPLRPVDLPTPPRAKPWGAWHFQDTVAYLSEDPLPFTNEDQPNPVRQKVYPPQADSYGRLPSSIPANVAAPFASRDLAQAPVSLRYRQADSYGPLPSSIPPPPPFFAQDFPNPRIPVRNPQWLEWNGTLGLPVVLAPFYQTEFPNPVLARRVQPVDPVGRAPDTIPSLTLPFFAQVEQPLTRLRYVTQVEQVGRPPNTIPPPVAPSPFAQLDYQNPRARMVWQETMPFGRPPDTIPSPPPPPAVTGVPIYNLGLSLMRLGGKV